MTMDKIKAVDPKIIVGGKADKPYYQIEYYDLSDNEWHIGYGSYCLANVKEWLKTCFEVINADVAPVLRGYWTQVDKNKCECSNCGIIVLIAVYPHGDKNYCPNCGAKMDGDGEKND